MFSSNDFESNKNRAEQQGISSESLDRPFRNLEKGTEESAANSDSLSNSRTSGISLLLGDKLTACVLAASLYKLQLFSIYLHPSRVA